MKGNYRDNIMFKVIQKTYHLLIKSNLVAKDRKFYLDPGLWKK